MCGIVAVLRRPARRLPPAGADVLAGLDRAIAAAGALETLGESATVAEDVDLALRGTPGITALLADPSLARAAEVRCAQLDDIVAGLEQSLDGDTAELGADRVEEVNAALVRLKDAAWAIRRDRLPTAAAVAGLAGETDLTAEATEGYASIQTALAAIDRLEVRGRDSAGIHVLVTGTGLDLSDPDLAALAGSRAANALLTSGALRQAAPHAIAFVYKAAAEIGELGDNTRVLRRAITGDDLLRRALSSPGAGADVIAHTRWASVGVISEPNAHPLNQEEDPRTADGPYVAAALNGDVDNHEELQVADGLRTAPEITTDAKVIPVMVARSMASGLDAVDAFAETVARFDGSVAICAQAAGEPGRLLLALRGSGQALYVGLAEDAFVVASEPYGLVEETSRYLRMDGEATGGQIVVLDRVAAGELAGISRSAYNRKELPVGEDECMTAGMTTRDIDRAGYPHFFLKEVSQAPESFRRTLRGKLTGTGARLTVTLPAGALPARVARALAAGEIRRVFAIGQGTAHVAAAVLADALDHALPASVRVRVEALPGSELSAFRLDDDMSDALVVAISQSGTTTDTNRTVDLARSRGAAVLAIVNRRGSDLAERADGVLYTSDGRDVEMSVASTKAFYAQVAAGILLAEAIAAELTGPGYRGDADLLAGLRDLPAAMEQVLEARPAIAAAAWEHAPARRHWAVVGSGANRFAAAELRIKLSELAYKAVACDATEDKKHIDLSSEPLVLVCAAGLPAAALSDLAKELAIFKAHKAAPVVLATEGVPLPAAAAAIPIPEVHPRLGFVLAAMAGHLFGYEAALAIDAKARALREARAAVEDVALRSKDPYAVMARLGAGLAATSARFHQGLADGAYNGSLEAGTAVRLASLLRYATGVVPLDVYELEHRRVGTPGVVIEDLLSALTDAIDELTRPVDAIKHQAKTVTVGISRPEEDLFASPLVAATLGAGPSRDRLSYRVLRTLAALAPAVDQVVGWTRYALDGAVTDDDGATVRVIGKGGVAKGIPSRAETDARPVLRGTKHRAATLREVTVARGGRDQRTVCIIPEITGGAVVGITLLHARFAERLAPSAMRAVLEGYQSRYGALVDAVTETEPAFDEARLGEVAVIDLLTSPVHVLAARWRDQ
ncbi:MAG: SIS domain-containing protein [Acidimicrobiia bacterium]